MQPTEPYRFAGIGVRALEAEVVEGPDAGVRHTATTETLSIGTAARNELVLSDNTVSRYHAELARTANGILITDCGSTNGTRIGAVRIDRGLAPAGTILRLGKSSVRIGDGGRLTLPVHEREALAGLRGRDPVMRRLMARVERAARTHVAVLLCGESGTGKELIARALHDLSARNEGPFVTVDCASLSPTLVASELFGHERGAFTGADRQHVGAFERADGGTLFLDEIGELPAALQTSFLGALERRRFRRLGGTRDITTDVRVVGATNRDLRAEVNRGAFRLDLYYRIAVVSLKVPPLRERPDDIPLLVEHFLRQCGHDGPIGDLISNSAMDSLRAHHWPGNVRELRNLVEATVAMGEAPPLDDGVLAGPSLDGHGDGDGGSYRQPDDLIATVLNKTYKEARAALLGEFELRYLRHLLDRAGGNVSRAAREARMDRSYLIDLLRRHKLR
ncbi:MAG: sigma 54-interacting transcriptional regulator [Myxococcota bacterium]